MRKGKDAVKKQIRFGRQVMGWVTAGSGQRPGLRRAEWLLFLARLQQGMSAAAAA